MSHICLLCNRIYSKVSVKNYHTTFISYKLTEGIDYIVDSQSCLKRECHHRNQDWKNYPVHRMYQTWLLHDYIVNAESRLHTYHCSYVHVQHTYQCLRGTIFVEYLVSIVATLQYISSCVHIIVDNVHNTSRIV